MVPSVSIVHPSSSSIRSSVLGRRAYATAIRWRMICDNQPHIVLATIFDIIYIMRITVETVEASAP